MVVSPFFGGCLAGRGVIDLADTHKALFIGEQNFRDLMRPCSLGVFKFVSQLLCGP